MTGSHIEERTSRAPSTSGSVGRSGAPSPLPMVIGVTGHHDLREADYPALEDAVATIFTDLQKRHRPTPLVLLAPLAEGADRLVARVAQKCGVRLIVPLPVPIDAYEREFATEDSRAELHKLLGSASLSYVLDDAGAAEPSGLVHQPAYSARMGAYVARRCQVLIALWDGGKSEGAGDTAAVVDLKLEGNLEVLPPGSPLDPPETGPVYHVMAARRGRPALATPGDVKWLYPGAPAGDPREIERFYRRATRAFHRVLARLDEFNREAGRLTGSSSREPEEAAALLIPHAESASLPDAAATILARFALADSLANRYRQRHVRFLQAVIGLAFLWTYLYQLHLLSGSMAPIDPVLLTAYVLVLLAAAAGYLWALWADYLNKFLDYRALAEGLRVQTFWTLTGLTEAVEDHYLRRQRSELDWIRNAIRAGRIVGGLDGEAQRLAASLPEDRASEVIVERWVDPQMQFMTSRAESHEATHRWIAWISDGSVALFLVLAILKVSKWQSVYWNAALTLAVTFAGLLSIYSYKCAFSEQSKQYHVMAQAFQSFRRRLLERRAGRGCDLRSLVRDLGKEALAENGDWVLLRRSRPTELPKY